MVRTTPSYRIILEEELKRWGSSTPTLSRFKTRTTSLFCLEKNNVHLNEQRNNHIVVHLFRKLLEAQ